MGTAFCFSCDQLVTECECGRTETFEVENGPTCPFCGELNKASDSDGALYNESRTSWSCDSCGKEFHLGVSCSYSWTAMRSED